MSFLTKNQSFISLKINRKFSIIDASKHFNDQTLASLLAQQNSNDFLREQVENDEQFSCMRNGLAFPASLQLHEYNNSMPEYEGFIDLDSLHSFSHDRYQNACDAYKTFGCTSILDYATYSLKSNAYGLANTLINYAKWAFSTYGVHPLNDISLSSFSWGAAHFFSKSRYENLCNTDLLKILKDSNTGGISSVIIREAEAVLNRLGDDIDD